MASLLNTIRTLVSGTLVPGILVAGPLAHLLTRLLLLGLAASLVAPLLYALLRLAPRWSQRIPARLRFRVLAAAFALMVAAPLLAVLLPALPHRFSCGLFALGTQGVSPLAAQPDPALRVLPAFAAAVALLWLAASACFALRLLRDFLRVRLLRRSAQPLAGSVSANPLAVAANQLCPIALSDQVSAPCLTGLLAPMVLLPADLPAQLSSSQLAAVVEHEFAHLRRRDPWTNLLQKLALVAFPLHPGLHLLDRWMSREREHACDEWVLQRAHAAREYAASLLDIAASGGGMNAVPLSAVGARTELSSRIERIVRPVPALPRRLAATIALLLTAGSASLAALVLHWMPPIAFAPSNAMFAASAGSTAFPAPRLLPSAFRASASLSSERQPYAARLQQRSFAPVRAVNTAWREPQSSLHPRIGAALQEAASRNAGNARPVRASMQAPMQAPIFAMVIETTTITESSYAAEPVSLRAEEDSISQTAPQTAAPAMASNAGQAVASESGQASGQAAMQGSGQAAGQTRKQSASSARASRQIIYSIVTTTLRITPAEYLRLERAAARKL